MRSTSMHLLFAALLCHAPSRAAAQPLQPVQILHRFESSPASPSGALVQVNLQDPRGIMTRYLAEGATNAFVHTRAIDPARIPALANATLSTIVESDAMIAVDRTMSWDQSGYGSHLETGVVAPSTTWYFAERSTSQPFALFHLLQHPQPYAVQATIRYLRPGGLPPIVRTYDLFPSSRRTIVVDAEGDALAATDVSAVITSDAPIVVERAMSLDRETQTFAAGHESAGVTAPALEWLVAEGATGAFFDLFVLIANPNGTAAIVDVEYLLPGGGSVIKTYTVPADARHTIWIDDESIPGMSGRPLADVVVSMAVRSTNGQPVVVERTMCWPGPAVSPDFWAEAHDSPGSTATATGESPAAIVVEHATYGSPGGVTWAAGGNALAAPLP